MQKLKVNIISEDLTEKEQEKLDQAVSHFEKAINSNQFLEFCNPFKRGGGFYEIKVKVGPWWKFWNKEYRLIKKARQFEGYGFKFPGGRSDLDVYNHLMTGSEVLNPFVDNVANVYLKIDKRNKKNVIGYTYPNTRWQWIYSNWFKKMTINEIAGNIAHEWCHKMGYRHNSKDNPTRIYTVPYAVGYFVRDFIGE